MVFCRFHFSLETNLSAWAAAEPGCLPAHHPPRHPSSRTTVGTAQGKALPLPSSPHQKVPTFRFACRSREPVGVGNCPLPSTPALGARRQGTDSNTESTSAHGSAEETLRPRPLLVSPAASLQAGPSRTLSERWARWLSDSIKNCCSAGAVTVTVSQQLPRTYQPPAPAHTSPSHSFEIKRSFVRAAHRPGHPLLREAAGLRPPGPRPAGLRPPPAGLSGAGGGLSQGRGRRRGRSPGAQRAGGGPGFRRLPEEEAGPNGLHTPSRGGRTSLPHD